MGFAKTQARRVAGQSSHRLRYQQPQTHNIEPDGELVYQAGFEEYADGKHSLESLRRRLSFWAW